MCAWMTRRYLRSLRPLRFIHTRATIVEGVTKRDAMAAVRTADGGFTAENKLEADNGTGTVEYSTLTMSGGSAV